MKTTIAYRICVLGALGLLSLGRESVCAQSQSMTAKQALSVLNSSRGAETMRNVVALRAWDGQHQPQQWEILTNSPKGLQRFVIGEERILSSDMPGGANVGRALDARLLKVDSTDAFRIADRETRAAKVGFDSIDYEMRGQDGGSRPVWMLQIKDVNGKSLGTLGIDGQSGAVLSRNWQGGGAANAQKSGGGAYDDYGSYDGDYVSYDNGSAGGGAYDSGNAYYGDDDAFRDPREPRVDYSKYEGMDYRDSTFAERQRNGFDSLRERVSVDMEDAGDKTKNGFVEIGDSFRDIFKGRASYRSTGRPHYRANRVSRARPR